MSFYNNFLVACAATQIAVEQLAEKASPYVEQSKEKFEEAKKFAADTANTAYEKTPENVKQAGRDARDAVAKVPTPVAAIGGGAIGLALAPVAVPAALGLVGLSAAGPIAGGLVAIGQSIAMGGALPATGYIGAAGLASYFSGRLVQSSKPVVEAEDDHATRDSEAGEVKESDIKSDRAPLTAEERLAELETLINRSSDCLALYRSQLLAIQLEHDAMLAERDRLKARL